jgi:hypothetical protein
VVPGQVRGCHPQQGSGQHFLETHVTAQPLDMFTSSRVFTSTEVLSISDDIICQDCLDRGAYDLYTLKAECADSFGSAMCFVRSTHS